MTAPLDFLVLGGGHAAYATAADLSLRGASVGMLEVPEFADQVKEISLRGHLELITGEDDTNRAVKLASAGTDPEVIARANTLLLVVPAYAERRFVAFVAPHLRRGQLLVFACGTFAEVTSTTNRGLWGEAGIGVLAIECLIHVGRRDGVSVRLGPQKRHVRAGAAAGNTGLLLERLRPGYPTLEPTDDALAAVLGNLNMVFHPVISLANLGRLGSTFKYYAAGVTEPVGALLASLDAERLAIGSAAGYTLSDASDTLERWYGHLGLPAGPLWQRVARNPVFASPQAPEVLEHRFLTEDVMCGLVPLETLGAKLRVATPLTTALVEMTSAALGRDVRRPS